MQGLMPVGMTLCLVLAITLASASADSRPWSWAAATAFATSLAFTLVINVPINLATGRWNPQHPPAGWEHHRGRWELGQGIRSWLLLAGFLLVCAAATL